MNISWKKVAGLSANHFSFCCWKSCKFIISQCEEATWPTIGALKATTSRPARRSGATLTRTSSLSTWPASMLPTSMWKSLRKVAGCFLIWHALNRISFREKGSRIKDDERKSERRRNRVSQSCPRFHKDHTTSCPGCQWWSSSQGAGTASPWTWLLQLDLGLSVIRMITLLDRINSY